MVQVQPLHQLEGARCEWVTLLPFGPQPAQERGVTGDPRALPPPLAAQPLPPLVPTLHAYAVAIPVAGPQPRVLLARPVQLAALRVLVPRYAHKLPSLAQGRNFAARHVRAA